MLSLHFKTRTYNLPDNWTELTADQFIYLVELLTSFTRGELSADVVRTLFFLQVAGIKPRRIRRQEREQLLSENVFRISRNFNFMFRVVYENGKAIASMSPDIQDLLTRWLPEEILTETPEIRVARKLEKHIEVDGTFACNCIPSLKIHKTTYPGYRFNRLGEVLNTDLPAGVFIDASTLHDQYMATQDERYLNLMVSLLYKIPEELVPGIPAGTRAAILFNFRAIMLFLSRETHYGLLWKSSGAAQAASLSIGFVDSLYTLSKAGYGDIDRLKTVSLVEFLDLLLKEIIDAVKQLKSGGKNLVEIAELTKLSLTQVQSIV